MLDEQIVLDAVDIILDNILTPVLYMYEDEAIEFICFPDGNISEEDINQTELELARRLSLNAEIVDIRSFDESDRVEITRNARLLYSENEFVKLMFESAMAADKARLMCDKREMISRNAETGTFYVN